MSSFRLLRLTAIAVAAVACSFAHASKPRIGVIDSGTTVTIPGNVSPRLGAAKDLGQAPAGQAIQRMSLRFNMTAAQQTALTRLLADLQKPASPQYHQWLTPEQFGAQFGLAADDLAKVSSWLSAQGFTVTSVGRGGMFVEFSGTVGQAEQAFHTELHNVQTGTGATAETHIANVSAPSLPAEIAQVTAAITGLSNFKMKPHSRVHSVKATGNEGLTSAAVQPEYTSSVSGTHYFAPGDFYTVYDEAAAISSNITGTGVKIAVVGQTDVYSADVANFRSVSGLAANAYTVVLDGADPGYSSNSGDILESEIDLEWLGAAAPGATILFVNSYNVIDGSLTYAVDNNLAPIITDSYGDCEPDLGASSLVYYESTLQMAAAEGISIVAASGDSGATDCDTGTSAVDGLSVDFPADSPYVTGVGGTEFNEGSGTYWAATNGSYQGSALSYIPEMVWNDDAAVIALGGGLSSGGGGASAYYSKPSWQVGTGVPNDFSRDVPDVALNASDYHDPYLICTQGYCVNGYRNANGYLSVAGGTSFGAPSFAGLLALVEQKTGARIGSANPTIYALANSTYAATVFHDVAVGTNASPCTAGSTNCPNGGTIGFAATTGYDQATGWGSVDVFNMVNDWALVTPLAMTGGTSATYTYVAGSASSASQGTSVTLTATVTGAASGTTPTGLVQFTVDSVAVGSAVTLNGGIATYTLSTTALSVGTHTVQATYTGSTTYAGSKGAFNLNVTSATASDFSLTSSAASVTTTSGGTAPGVVLTVGALNGFTGNVTFTASASSSLNAEYSFSLNPVTLSSTATSASTTLTLFAYAQAGHFTPGLGRRGTSQTISRMSYAAGSGIALAGIMLLLLPRRRRLGTLTIAVIAVAATLGVSGCANNSSGAASGPSTVNTPSGTYPVTISATGTVNGSTVTHSIVVNFVVQ
jgi:subtilase family serine protease